MPGCKSWRKKLEHWHFGWILAISLWFSNLENEKSQINIYFLYLIVYKYTSMKIVKGHPKKVVSWRTLLLELMCLCHLAFLASPLSTTENKRLLWISRKQKPTQYFTRAEGQCNFLGKTDNTCNDWTTGIIHFKILITITDLMEQQYCL